MKVGVIDYGVGNLGSVVQVLEEMQLDASLITDTKDLPAMDCLILPGVGNFADCKRLLENGGWPKALRNEVKNANKPLLGVCVGMQLLASYSMEGADEDALDGTLGLGLIPGRVEHLTVLGCNLRVPHVGWNEITVSERRSQLFDGIPNETDFYFVHSYAFIPDDPSDVLATTEYDIPVTAAVNRGCVWGTQFHPEKSSRAGKTLLSNFVKMTTC